MMASKTRVSKEVLRELCVAHKQIVQAKEEHLSRADASQVVVEMYDQKARELEREITSKVKLWLGCEKAVKVSK
jgi:predicted house-cleaning NTP pyrophosphatase (Maf/HAM1 superfamily)